MPVPQSYPALKNLIDTGNLPEPVLEADSGRKWEKHDYKTELFKWDGEKVIKINSK
jgi:hypothetical protein